MTLMSGCALQIASGAHHGAAGADAGDEMGHLPSVWSPDFGAGGLEMRQRVGLVVVLVGLEVALGILRGDLAAQHDRAIGSFQRIGIDDLGAKRFDDPLALAADIGAITSSTG